MTTMEATKMAEEHKMDDLQDTDDEAENEAKNEPMNEAQDDVHADAVMTMTSPMEDGESKEEEKEEPAVPASSQDLSNEQLFTPELLQMYYSRLFPFELLHAWLSYGAANNSKATPSASASAASNKNSQLFRHREFSFTIEPVPGNEIYIRYQSYNNAAQLREAIQKKRPHKIDIGAVFQIPPKDHQTVPNFSKCTQQRELVFDIDLTDYDPIRFCGCTGAKICPKCWSFMTMAIDVMDQGLRQDFGFEQIAWIYSGRRGVHAWVCDEAARELPDMARSAIAQYFEVSIGDGKSKKGDKMQYPLHPMMTRAFEILEPMFIDTYITEEGHGLLASQDRWEELLDTLPTAASMVCDRMLKSWNDLSDISTPAEKWGMLRHELSIFCGAHKTHSNKKLAKHYSAAERIQMELWPIQTVFRCTYPRLDINVSKMQNHLLKSPFCIHPKTGRVCVPIDDAATFDPFTVPTLPQLMRELDAFGDGQNTKHEWEKTSLKGPFQSFQKKFLNPMLNDLRRSQRDEAEKQAAMMGDF